MDKHKADQVVAKKGTRRLLIVGTLILMALLGVLLVVQLISPRRSVAAYCQTYAEEKTRLAKLPGDTWPSGVFNETVGDAGEFAASFDKLEKVAPDEIRPDVATLQSIYQKIHDDPSQAISASLSGASAENNVKQWTAGRCGS